MNKDETVRIMDMMRFKLRGIAADLMYVGKHSNHVYQAKCDRYSSQINDMIMDIFHNECDDIE